MNPHAWNETVWQRLLQLREKLPHALLFHGRAGIGKLALAEQLAQLVLCENPQADGREACGVCPSCHWLRQNSHPDFIKLQPAALDEDEPEAELAERKSLAAGQRISVAQVRELTQFVQLSAHRGGLRIALIHPAEAMNAAAANALLKTASLAQAGGAPLLAIQLADADYQERRRGFLTGLVKMNTADSLRIAEHHAKQPLQDMVHWLQLWVHDLVSLHLAGRVFYQVDYEQELRGMAGRANLFGLLDFQRRLQAARASVLHPLATQMVLEDLLLEYAGLFE